MPDIHLFFFNLFPRPAVNSGAKWRSARRSRKNRPHPRSLSNNVGYPCVFVASCRYNPERERERSRGQGKTNRSLLAPDRDRFKMQGENMWHTADKLRYIDLAMFGNVRETERKKSRKFRRAPFPLIRSIGAMIPSATRVLRTTPLFSPRRFTAVISRSR